MKWPGLIHLLLLVGLLAACAPAAPPPAPDEAAVRESWVVLVAGETATTTRQLHLEAEVAALLRGSPALDPMALKNALAPAGASNATCQVDDDGRALAIACRYQQTLPPGQNFHRLALPEDGWPALLAGVPVDFARGLRVATGGRVTVPGVLLGLPAAQEVRLENGSLAKQRYRVASLSSFTMSGETWLPPGQIPAALALPPVTVVFVWRYFPRPAAWLALALALLVSLLAISAVFPVRARQAGVPAPWQPELRRVHFLLRWPARLVVWLVNGLRRAWPLLLQTVLGFTLVAWGVEWLFLAWGVARGADALAGWTLTDWPIQLPLTELARWPGWPVAVAAMGLALAAAGLGLLLRHRGAWRLALGLTLALLGALILAWPHLLLAPPLLPYQLELLLAGFGCAVAFLALLAHALNHAQFRRYYRGLEEGS